MLEEFNSPDAVITVFVGKCLTFLSFNLNLNAEYGTFHHLLNRWCFEPYWNYEMTLHLGKDITKTTLLIQRIEKFKFCESIK